MFGDTRYSHLLDTEVLYVGQAYGEGGSRVAPERLKTHSTLQGIYAEALRASPDTEIWIALWSFELMILTSFDSRFPVATTLEQDDSHIANVLGKGISEQQQINFTEAALIRYFQPEYNTMFKESFPSPAHSTYAECYGLDLNTVNVELQCEPLGCRLWSNVVAPEWDHFVTFPLHSPEARKEMFDLLV